MSGQKDEKSISPPPGKRFRYQQGKMDSEQLYLQTKYADVYFVFNSNDGTVVRVPAHKVLLAAASDVFGRMFYGEMKETGDVTIADASEAAFKEFLQFFYLSEIELTVEQVASVMDLGNKYNVKKCIDACVQLLKGDLTIETVCTTLSLALLYDQEELTKACEKCILVSTEDFFKTAAFLECDKKVLTHILDMKLLSCSEVEVFESCMAWVQAKSKQNTVVKAMVEEHLGNLYYKIRFASMTIQEFCALERKYKAVLYIDLCTIICIITQSQVEPHHFNIAPRQVEWNDNENIMCNRDDYWSTGYEWCALNDEEKITFSTNQPLLLGEFDCKVISPDKIHWVTNLSVKVEITEARALDGASAKDLSNMTVNMGATDLVSLPHPILIRPDYFYTICIRGFPKDHYFNAAEQSEHELLDNHIEIKFHNDRIVDRKIFGLIWALHFNDI